MDTPARGPASEESDTARHRALSAASRVRMLALVRRSPGGMTAADLAAGTGLHPGTVRAHLHQLTSSGLVTRQRDPDGTPGRPAWRYHAAGKPGAGNDRPYRDLAAALISQLAQDEPDPHGSGVRAGRGWGRALAGALGRVAPLDGLLHILRRLGFDPKLVSAAGAGPAVVLLRSCPYLELAETSPDVVCGVHLGLISGALGALGGRAAATELKPFGAPDGCVIHVHAQGGAPAARRRSP
jgi:predicted ArsR family transcriptional regulator